MVSSPLPAATTGTTASTTARLTGAPIGGIETTLIPPRKKDKATGLRRLLDTARDTKNVLLALAVVAIAWVVLGISALIQAGTCFGSNSTLAEKVVGLLLAVLLGPFYWIYFKTSTTYCKYPSRARAPE